MSAEFANVAVAGVAVVLTLIGMVAGWALRIARGENAEKKADSNEVRIIRLEKDLADYKVHVAANYASNTIIEQVETRLIEAISRLGDRLDRLFERRPTRG